ncbi:hypothetical protein HAX54_032804 [Datura stramonium]|uniref:Uncharacterized protein n=1 Tax=Datura stramonium TaxID=4076 RepID=A0ABS8VEP2_DATST|nr:hypothetical protein [Datura stramonium]
METRGLEWVEKYPIRMQACHQNHHGGMGSVGSWIKKDMLRRERVKKGQIFSFGCLLTRFLREQKIDEMVVNSRPRYDPNGLDMMRKMEPEGIHGPILSINKEQARVDSDLESDDDGDYSEIGEATFSPIDDKD